MMTGTRLRRSALGVLATALCVAGIGGCRQSRSEETPAVASAPVTTTAPAHEHQAPHGGTLVELGDEFAHLEFVRDRTARTLTAYVLDGEAEQAVRIAQGALTLRLESPVSRTVALTVVSNPLTGETVGDSSQFAATGDVFGSAGAVRGVLDVILVRGQTFKEVPFTVGE